MKNYEDLDLDAIKKKLSEIVDQHKVMSQLLDLNTVKKELKEAIKWFLDPIESEGRKDE